MEITPYSSVQLCLFNSHVTEKNRFLTINLNNKSILSCKNIKDQVFILIITIQIAI